LTRAEHPKLAAMTDAIRRRRPGRNASGDRHDVDQDAQGGREIDAAAEQNAEIAAKQTGAVKLKDAGDAGTPETAVMIAAPAPAGEAATRHRPRTKRSKHHDGRVRPKKVGQFDEDAERGV